MRQLPLPSLDMDTSGPWKNRLFASAVLLAGLHGCGDREVIHPNADNRPPRDAATISRDSLPDGLSAESLAAWRNAREAILSAHATLNLGSQEPGPELFSYVSDAEIASDGNIVVLDEFTQEVRIFDPSGSYVDGFGGLGDGPMELRAADHFELLPGGRIAVPIGNSGRVKVFQRLDNEWTLEEMLDFQVTPTTWRPTICAMDNGQLFATGLAEASNTVINGPTGAIQRFGEGYRHDDTFIRREMSSGSIECLDDSARIVFGFHYMPVVRMYSALDGGIIWTSAHADNEYLQVSVVEGVSEIGTTSVSFRQHEMDSDRLALLAQIGQGGHVLLQNSRILPEERKIVAQTYLLDAVTGAGAFLGDTLPPILSAQADGYIAVFEDPYPRLEVRTFGPGREFSDLPESGSSL